MKQSRAADAGAKEWQIRHGARTDPATAKRRQRHRDVLRCWPLGDWLSDPRGAPAALETVTIRYRNPVAYTEELTEVVDYRQCADFVVGGSGVLWSLIRATSPR